MSLILDGATRALAKRGLRKFSMSDVCVEAGISRGTVYRYFKNKDEVLEAIRRHVLASVTTVVQDAVSVEPAPEDRLRVILQAMLDYPRRFPYVEMIIRREPGFALGLFTEALPDLIGATATALAPVLEQAPPVLAQVTTPKDLAEFLERLILSFYLVPPTQGDLPPARLDAAFRLVVGDRGSAVVAGTAHG
jgi:AcrR family transcriptional regulator